MDLNKSTQVELRKFLSSLAGQEIMEILRERTPKLVKGNSPETIMYDAGEVAGWTGVINLIGSLARKQDKPEIDTENN